MIRDEDCGCRVDATTGKRTHFCAYHRGREEGREEAFDRVRAILDDACTCGGDGPGACCQACELWHALKEAS